MIIKKILLFIACSLTFMAMAQNNIEEKSPISICSCVIPLDTSFHVVPFIGGTPPDYRTDGGTTAAIAIPFSFNFYGTNYTSLYINANGNVSFSAAFSGYNPSAFPNTTAMIAPFWANVDTRGAASGLVYYQITSHHITIKWDSVGYYNAHTDKLNTFQLILTDGTDPLIATGGNVKFCYGNMQWTTGDASNGTNGFGGNAATVGVNQGGGALCGQVGQFNASGTTFISPTSTNNQVGWLTNKSFSFDVSSINIPPVIINSNSCDTVTINTCTDTTMLNALVLSPETNQTTTLTVNLNGLSGATVYNPGSGNSVSAQVVIVNSAANIGCWTVTFTATDNGIPQDVTTSNIVVCVNNCSTVGIKDNIISSSITIAPNPFTSQTTLSFSSEQKNTTIHIIDVLGKEIKSETFSGKQFIIEKGEMNPGIYFVQVTDANKNIINKKIIIQ